MLEKGIGNLVGEMHKNKISKTRLAEHMGVSCEHVSMVLSGHREPGNEDLKKFVKMPIRVGFLRL